MKVGVAQALASYSRFPDSRVFAGSCESVQEHVLVCADDVRALRNIFRVFDVLAVVPHGVGDCAAERSQ